MKKLSRLTTLLALLFALAVPFVSCKKDKAAEAEKQIQEAVKGMNLPKECRNGMKLTACSYGDKQLTYRFEVDKETFNNLNTEKAKENTAGELSSGLFTQKLLNKISEAKASIRYVFTNGGQEVSYVFMPSNIPGAPTN